jgi:O-succinylbenzoate synthase
MLIGNINNAVEAGFPRIKLKVARGWDLDMLKVVRSAFPNTTFHIDCNGGYSLDDMQLFEAIDRLDLAFIEQPLHYADLLDHAELAKRIKTPVCLDESITSVRSARQALDVGACTIVNIKPARVGGLANSVAIHDLCRDNGVPVWVGGMLESAVGAAVCVELATLENFSYPGDLFPSDRFYENDLSNPPLALTNQLTFEPFTEGLPEPDPIRLKQCTVQTRTISAKN